MRTFRLGMALMVGVLASSAPLAKQLLAPPSVRLSGSTGAGPENRWLLCALQSRGAPPLGLKPINAHTVMVYWPQRPEGFDLRVATTGGKMTWLRPPETVQEDGTNLFILTSPSAGTNYYQLEAKP